MGALKLSVGTPMWARIWVRPVIIPLRAPRLTCAGRAAGR